MKHGLTRVLCLLACIPSGGALLAKVYGIGDMSTVTLLGFLPCAMGLAWMWHASKKRPENNLSHDVALGFVGGLLGTLAYDLIRIPFLLMGLLVFAPISAYGVWILDASYSSRFTDVTGWLYHFSNGITFGIMYGLFMRGRHWMWAVAWGCALETIAVWSPFGTIFHISGNYSSLGIAYLGHVAYGIPLGVVMLYHKEVLGILRALSFPAKTAFWLLWLILPAVFLLYPKWRERDRRARNDTFRIEENNRLNPSWLRIDKAGTVTVVNATDETKSVQSKNNSTVVIAPGGSAELHFERTGIFQTFVATPGRKRSSFVIVEPVEEIDRP